VGIISLVLSRFTEQRKQMFTTMSWLGIIWSEHDMSVDLKIIRLFFRKYCNECAPVVFTHIHVTKENGFSFLRFEMLWHFATLRVTFFCLAAFSERCSLCLKNIV